MMLCSWDAEEYSLIGSVEFAEVGVRDGATYLHPSLSLALLTSTTPLTLTSTLHFNSPPLPSLLSPSTPPLTTTTPAKLLYCNCML